MVDSKNDLQAHKALNVTFPLAILFMLAMGILMLMSAMEPSLALPLMAFAAMASLTCLLGKRLFRDLNAAPGQVSE